MADTKLVAEACPICKAFPEIKYKENYVHKWQLRCSNLECTNRILVDRDSQESAIRYWNKVCARIARGESPTEKKYITELDERAEAMISDGARCPKCFLLLPCNDCIKPIEFYADARKGYDTPTSIGRRDSARQS
jgi:hypothetical protein